MNSKASRKSGQWLPRVQILLAGLAIFLVGWGLFAVLGTIQIKSPSSSVTLSSPPRRQLVPALAVRRRPPVDCAIMNCLALTFDDGPNSVTTPQILAELEAADVPATFFVVGIHVPGREPILQRMFADGDEIGNHSWSHPDFTKLTTDQMRWQIFQTQLAVAGAGVPAPQLFRPPYEATNSTVKTQVPLTFAMWNIDPEDWNTPDPNQIIANVVTQARRGGVVELHDTHGATAQALPAILQNLKTRFTLVTFSQMFNLSAGQQGQYFGR